MNIEVNTEQANACGLRRDGELEQIVFVPLDMPRARAKRIAGIFDEAFEDAAWCASNGIAEKDSVLPGFPYQVFPRT